MRGLSAFMGLTLAAVFAWLAYLAVATPPYVSVEVKNLSDRAIARIELELHRPRSTLVVYDIEPGAKRQARIHTEGENGMGVRVVFADGRVAQEKPIYVEPGYVINKTVTDRAIDSEFDLPGGNMRRSTPIDGYQE